MSDAGGRGAVPPAPEGALQRLAAENERLRERYARANAYIRAKVNELLCVMGTSPLREEELDDETLIELDPIGIVATSFCQILEHLGTTNEKLRFANEEIRAIFDSAGLGILVVDPALRVIACNSSLKDQFFPEAGDATGRLCHEMVCGFPEPSQCPFSRIFRSGEPMRVAEWPIRGRFYDVVGTPVRDRLGAVSSVVLIYQDITERNVAVEALRRSEERYRDLFENAHDLIMSVRLDGSIEYVNQSWCDTLGYDREETARLSLFELLHEDCAEECQEKLRRMLAEGERLAMRTFLRAKDGHKVVVEGDVGVVREAGRRVGLRGILRDITDREQLEEEILKREKLESIGVLAGGIAHDFNNILTGVLGNLSLAALHAPPGGELRTRLKEAEQATLSARELTRQLLTFAQGGEPVKHLTPLEELVRTRTTFTLRGSAVRCAFDIPAGLWAAEVDEGQIGQVLHNLVLNASQAMPVGGLVRVGADNVEVAERDGLPVPPGAYVRLTVADEGCGIPAERLPRIFDPYFTTKGDGSGLGLTIVHSIVTKHGGCVRVASEPGRGSTFSVYLPASGKCAPPKAEAAPEAPAGRGRGRVLVMDDEEIVREVAKHMLAELGYEPVCVANGEEAIGRYRAALESGRRFDAVIMDLTIPGAMGGREAVQQLARLDPSVKAIVSSGYSTDPIMAHFREHGFFGVIAKPYRLADLATVVAEAVRGGGAAPGDA